MKTRISKTLVILPLVALIGCADEPAEEAGEDMAEDTVESVTDTTALTDAAPIEMAAERYTIAITNPMPHEMIVYYEKPGGPAVELGSVQANETAQFEITTPEDKRVELRATDVEETHTVTGTVSMVEGETVEWRIEKS